MHDDRRGASNFKRQSSKSTPGERFERQTFNMSISMDLALVVSNTRRSRFRLFDDIKHDAIARARASITKASKIRRQVFDGAIREPLDRD